MVWAATATKPQNAASTTRKVFVTVRTKMAGRSTAAIPVKIVLIFAQRTRNLSSGDQWSLSPRDTPPPIVVRAVSV